MGKDGSKYIPLPQIILGNMFYYRPCLGSKNICPEAYYVQRIMIKISWRNYTKTFTVARG